MVESNLERKLRLVKLWMKQRYFRPAVDIQLRQGRANYQANMRDIIITLHSFGIVALRVEILHLLDHLFEGRRARFKLRINLC